jgi:hypothetical protein
LRGLQEGTRKNAGIAVSADRNIPKKQSQSDFLSIQLPDTSFLLYRINLYWVTLPPLKMVALSSDPVYQNPCARWPKAILLLQKLYEILFLYLEFIISGFQQYSRRVGIALH